MNSRRLLGISLLAVIAGCSQTDKATDVGVTPENTTQQQASTGDQLPAVIQGACPQVYLRDGTAVHRAYAKGKKSGDPEGVTYQATLVDTTRQCIQTASEIKITVMAQGRLVEGPAGSSGTINLPIRVAVSDGTTTLFSELTQLPVTIPADSGTTQFVFTNANVTIPGGAGGFTKIYLGFDEGPYNTK
ncbi:hypothetical protein LXM94_09175 [Rhizobium sp. TRM95111]|uniref:hypothetical protein n=1 Tax=Rhizobium alarense TaxID=2846851 RepID=UPI001F3E441B|nr:hypothetical protein [Rhizobium alarense]MCF3640139.1 hypothetical protein [Rhizobium alarense]